MSLPQVMMMHTGTFVGNALGVHIVMLENWLISASAAATVTAVIVLLFESMPGRLLTPQWRHRLWWLVVVPLVLPALPTSKMSLANIAWANLARHVIKWQSDDPKPSVPMETSVPTSANHSNVSVVVGYHTIPTADHLNLSSSVAPSVSPMIQPRPGTLRCAVTATWVLIADLLLARLLLLNRALNHRLRGATRVSDPHVLALLDHCRHIANVRAVIPLFTTDVIRAPAAAGVIRRRILLPEGQLSQLSSVELKAVFLHELAHIRCRDVAANWVLAFVGTVNWFNPVVWLALSRLKAERELARDATVLDQLAASDCDDPTEQYCRLLLKLADALVSFPASTRMLTGIVGIIDTPGFLIANLSGSGRALQRRLNMIAQRIPRSRRRSILGLLIATSVACATLTRAQAPSPPVQPDAQPATAPSAQASAPAAIVTKVVADENANGVANAQLNKVLPEVKFDNIAMGDVFDFLRDISGANIFVNWKSLKSVGIAQNAPITLRLRNVTLASVLTTVLASADGNGKTITFHVDQDVIVVCSARDLAKTPVTRVYDIRDLIIDVPDFLPIDPTDPTSRPSPSPGEEKRTKEQITTAVIKLLTDTVASDTWKDNGGDVGSINNLSGQLVITQTPEAHTEIQKLLDQIREQRGLQISVAAKFISCDPRLVQSLLSDWQVPVITTTQPANSDIRTTSVLPTTRPAAAGKAFYLSDQQVNGLLHAIQDSNGATIAAPRLTLVNGQRADVRLATEYSAVTDYTTQRTPDGKIAYEPKRSQVLAGLVLDVQATASADRKNITLMVQPSISALAGIKELAWPSRPVGSTLMVEQPQLKSSHLSTVISVPDGGTMLLGGMEDPGIGKDAGFPAATQPAAPRYLFLLIKPTLISRDNDHR